jgi:hypothetical protein
MLPFLMVALLAAFVAACGSGNDEGGSEARDASGSSTSTVDPGSPEGVEAKTGSGSLAITPELVDCMNAAGFSQDPTPASGAVASWRSDSGARVAVAPSSEAALTLAGEVGTASAPASVDGTNVTVGPAADTGAALRCLDA